MNAVTDLYNRISEINGSSINKWVREVKKRLAQFSKNVSTASPFKDKPTYQKDFRKGRFWISGDPKEPTIRMFGVAPNAGRVQGFGAPINQWHDVEPYRFEYPDSKPLFGRNRAQYGTGWVTYGKAQVTRSSAGVPIKTPHLNGKPVKAVRYFGINGMGYGRTESGKAMPVYYESAFVDWMMERHNEEIERIIIEAGNDVISDILGGAK